MKRLGNLEALRAEMRAHNVDVFFMTGSDPHQSEYASERFRTREWLTGFSGSSGKAAATLSEAGLWTDGRYFIQAAEQLRGSGFDLYKQDVAGVPGIIEWICDKIPTGGTLGFDGSAVSASEMKRIKKRLSCKNIKYASAFDPIGKLWKGRPGFPEEKIFEHPARFAGAPVKHKLGLVRAEMKNLGADFYFTPAPECVAWLLNIRGRDVFNTPVAYAFCLIGEDSATLFADLNKIDGPLERRLAEDGIELRGYGEAEKSLRYLGNGLSLFYDAGRVSALLEESIPEGVSVK
ncbi:MAG: aminopeptidase P family N-terminal domain-containing protein, partial [Defluviitaleaceae bacterium]|nr:aminopeptidase P family N-terminal domain-containing protein [Defluviitaleaceae bacterium]